MSRTGNISEDNTQKQNSDTKVSENTKHRTQTSVLLNHSIGKKNQRETMTLRENESQMANQLQKITNRK